MITKYVYLSCTKVPVTVYICVSFREFTLLQTGTISAGSIKFVPRKMLLLCIYEAISFDFPYVSNTRRMEVTICFRILKIYRAYPLSRYQKAG
jgi:hypothetical protein